MSSSLVVLKQTIPLPPVLGSRRSGVCELAHPTPAMNSVQCGVSALGMWAARLNCEDALRLHRGEMFLNSSG